MKTLGYKKFVFITIVTLILYVVFHFTIYHYATSKIFAREDGLYIGDIARVSYQTDALYPRKRIYTLPKKHLQKEQYNNDTPIDILTLGDSFSNSATGGKNPYYQDYLATKYNANVLNIVDSEGSTLHTFEPVIALYNSGWLDAHHVKSVIIQSVERFCVMRYAKDFNWNAKRDDIEKLIRSARKKDAFIPHINFISSANYKYLYYNFQAKRKVHFHVDVDLLQLKEDLFTPHNFCNKLLIHHEDILSIAYNTQKNIEKINNNFNHLAKLLAKSDIQLIFMPTVDKYDLYYPYIKNNPYPKNHFFTYLRPLQKEYTFIDTKKILQEALKKGLKNLYYPDDTHWSNQAIRLIVPYIQIKGKTK